MGITNAPIPITTLAHSALTGVTTAQHHTSPAPASSTNDAIARYDGVSGALQDYTSLAPTISDAGIVALTSGALKWPSTAIPSGDANTLDDYEEGSWTPGLADNNLDGSGEGQGYGHQTGRYTRVGNMVTVYGSLSMTSLGTLTTAQNARIVGLPFTSSNVSNLQSCISVGYATDLAITVNTSVTGEVVQNNTIVTLRCWDAAGGVTGLLLSEFTAAGTLFMSATYPV